MRKHQTTNTVVRYWASYRLRQRAQSFSPGVYPTPGEGRGIPDHFYYHWIKIISALWILPLQDLAKGTWSSELHLCPHCSVVISSPVSLYGWQRPRGKEVYCLSKSPCFQGHLGVMRSVKDSNGVLPKPGGAKLEIPLQISTQILGMSPQNTRVLLTHVPTPGPMAKDSLGEEGKKWCPG